MNVDLTLATLRLFKAVPIDKHSMVPTNPVAFKRTIENGYIFTPDVFGIDSLIELVNGVWGINARNLNQTFHKSWDKVANAPIQQLVIEQIAHYITTYGFEELGLYHQDFVYVPHEKLDVPELTEDFRLTVIRGMTADEFRDKVSDLLSSGVALSEQSVNDAYTVAVEFGFNQSIFDIKNHEVQVKLFDYHHIVPDKPVDFLRYAVYRSTGETLLIKNSALINKIQNGNPVLSLFQLYDDQQDLSILATIFNRYKPLFLAFKSQKGMAPIINKIRRLATVYHKPMPKDVLNSVTADLKNHTLDLKGFNLALNQANTFRKVRLAYALQNRISGNDSIVYQIRNGKSYATDFKYDVHVHKTAFLLHVVLNSIAGNLTPKVGGKRVYIPAGMNYALPATEKKFTGNIPSGSYVEVPGDMVVGIHWNNVGNHRIDLDLSLMNAEAKVGWDAAYRSHDRSLLFSGDRTDAPNPAGASELFRISGTSGAWMMNVNYYNFYEYVDVPFQIVVGEASGKGANYTIDPNHLIASANSVMDVHQKTLGLVVSDDKSRKFYFTESNFGGGRTSVHRPYIEQGRQFLVNSLLHSISLNDLLVRAGAVLVDNQADADIDLSTESLDKTTILALLS